VSPVITLAVARVGAPAAPADPGAAACRAPPQ